MRKVVFMIDGWFMRKRVQKLKAFTYTGPEIREYCLKHMKCDDYLYRIFYYDTLPLDKKGRLPISQAAIDFSKTPVAVEQNRLLKTIKETPNFALRLGKTVWKNNAWVLNSGKLKELLNATTTIDKITDTDFKPNIQQKAVDMRMGLDIALIATHNYADLLIIITGDADIVPALKFARREGMQVGLDPLRNNIREELREHVDFIESKI